MISDVVEPRRGEGREPAGTAHPDSTEPGGDTSGYGEPAEAGLVRLGDTTVSLAVLRAHPEVFARTYEQTKATVGYAECLCVATGPPEKLVIRSRQGRFHLACWPGRRGAHAPHCHFHQLSDHMSGRSRYAAAVEEDVDGVRIHLNVALTVNLAEARRRATPVAARQGGESQAAMTLLGLLHHLWERSALNRWPGRRGHRGWRECVHQLVEAIDETRLDQTALSQILYLVRPYSPDTAAENDAAFERFAGRLGRRGELARRGLLLGEIKAVTPAKGGWRIGLRQTKTPVFLDGPLLTRLKRSYPAVFSAARPQDARQVVLLVVDRSSGGHLRLVDAAAMLTTRDAVPADSSFEVIMADRLVGAGRAFVKPLRFDQGDDLLFPDYILIDVEPHVAVEVWGVKGREIYDLRRRTKLGLYERSGPPLPLLQWDVTEPLPDVELRGDPPAPAPA